MGLVLDIVVCNTIKSICADSGHKLNSNKACTHVRTLTFPNDTTDMIEFMENISKISESISKIL